MEKSNRFKEQALSYDTLIDRFNYCPDTGIFIYRKTVGSRGLVGTQAGTLNNMGYRCIKIKSFLYLEHRLAWFYCFNEWPIDLLDHINRIRDDNRLDNLREVSESDNLQNMGISKRNKSGFKGVSLQSGRWCARIMISGKEVHLGRFDTPEQAAHAYETFKTKL